MLKVPSIPCFPHEDLIKKSTDIDITTIRRIKQQFLYVSLLRGYFISDETANTVSTHA